MGKKNFFESVYKNANHDDLSAIPWATLAPNVYLEKHLSKPIAPYQCCILYKK